MLVWTAHMLLLPGKAEVINAREVAPQLASAGMFNSSEQSEEGECRLGVGAGPGRAAGRHEHTPTLHIPPHPIWGWEWLWQSHPIPSWPHKTLHNDWSSPSSQRVKRASVISTQAPPGPPGAGTRRE